MIDAIDHVVLTSSNLENTLNFYCKVLGMKLKKEQIVLIDLCLVVLLNLKQD